MSIIIVLKNKQFVYVFVCSNLQIVVLFLQKIMFNPNPLTLKKKTVEQHRFVLRSVKPFNNQTGKRLIVKSNVSLFD